MTPDLLNLVALILMGVFYVEAGFFLSRLIAPHYPGPVKCAPYECGELPFGSAWARFHVGYYLFALLFLVFDVEVALCFPWAVVLREGGVAALGAGLGFILVLAFGLVFAWRKGYLVWH